MIERSASCSCGGLRATCRGEPARVSVCHCLDCKRRTGSAFAYSATFPSEQVETRGPSSTFTRVSDEGFWARFNFCPACGGAVFYEIERRPGMVTIPAGAFADPAFPEPTVAVFEERAQAWCVLRTEKPMASE